VNLNNTNVKNEKLYASMEHDIIIHLIETVKKVFIFIFFENFDYFGWMYALFSFGCWIILVLFWSFTSKIWFDEAQFHKYVFKFLKKIKGINFM